MRKNIDIKILKPLYNNPRNISQKNFEKLKRDIKKDPDFLDKRPLLVNFINGEYIVYAGNMRLKACLDLGWEDIPCDIDDNLAIELMNERVLRDNVEYGKIDYDILANNWQDLVIKLDLPELSLPIDKDIDNDILTNKDIFNPKEIICPHCQEKFYEIT